MFTLTRVTKALHCQPWDLPGRGDHGEKLGPLFPLSTSRGNINTTCSHLTQDGCVDVKHIWKNISIDLWFSEPFTPPNPLELPNCLLTSFSREWVEVKLIIDYLQPKVSLCDLILCELSLIFCSKKIAGESLDFSVILKIFCKAKTMWIKCCYVAKA